MRRGTLSRQLTMRTTLLVAVIAIFLSGLTAIAMHQGAQAALLDARRQLLSHRIQLHRALGGTWADSLIEEAESNTP